MKIIFAPDSFKHAMRSAAAGRALADGWREQRPGDELLVLPVADGGEGTCEAVTAAVGGRLRRTTAHDALGRQIEAVFGVTGDGRGAVAEMAAAAGIELLAGHELDPLAASTYGVGELLRAMLDSGARRLLLGIGGSATVDGGIGMLQALGARCFSVDGTELSPGLGGGALERLGRIDCSGLDPRLAECTIEVACDVDNPLTGADGSAAVFAPQKGASPAEVERLDAGLAGFARLIDPAFTAPGHPGDGAAGGLGFTLRRVLHAKIASGAALVLNFAGFDRELEGASLVVTGEGCTDSQTLHGKLCAVIAEIARRRQVPVVLASGALRGDVRPLFTCFDAVFSIADGPGDLDGAIAATEVNLRRCGRNLAALSSIFTGTKRLCK